MMKKINIVGSAIALTLILHHTPAFALAHSYPSDTKMAVQIGTDLYDSLDAKYRNRLEAQPVRPIPCGAPALSIVESADSSRRQCHISISDGLVDLVNHIAHAKAVDRAEPGFFTKYMNSLATQSKAPEIEGDAYWSDTVMNDQASYFNQIMGMTMAINLSHYYLGQFDRHASQLQGAGAVPITTVLSGAEWDTGVRAGAVNSLNCAYGTEGAKALFEAIGKMPRRPSWAAFFVPEKTDISRLNNQLAKYEVDFFHGKLN